MEQDSYRRFKAEQLDTKSKTFCGAKWLGATLWLAHGKTSSCHLPVSHKIDAETLEQDPAVLHNTPHKLEMRQLMKEGKRPSECQFCWSIEDLSSDALSERVFKSHQFSENDLKKAYEQDAKKFINPRYLEISFDRQCQMSCSYCSSLHSTTWLKSMETHGYFKNLMTENANQFNFSAEHDYLNSTEQKYFQDKFSEWWPSLRKDLRSLRVTGGEPLMSENFWKFLEQSSQIDQDEAKEIHFSVNSNLMCSEEKLNRLIQQSQHFKHLRLFTSCESVGLVAEYIRKGLNYSVWERNLKTALASDGVNEVYIMMTINGLSLFSILPFLNKVKEIKKQTKAHKLKISVNLLRNPSFQSALILPMSYRLQIANELKSFLFDEAGSSLFTEFEKSHLQRLILFLEKDHIEKQSPSSLQALESDFKNFYHQYDQRFKLDLQKIIPNELQSWFSRLRSIYESGMA